MLSDSMPTGAAAPEQSARIFAFNSKGSKEVKATVPGMAPEVVSPEPEKTEVPDPFDITGSIAGARPEGVRLSISPEGSVSDLVVESGETPAEPAIPEAEFPAFQNLPKVTAEVEPEVAVAPEIVADMPAAETVDPNELTAEETDSLETVPQDTPELTAIQGGDELEEVETPVPELKAVESEEIIEEEPAIFDIDATIAESYRLEQESDAKREEADAKKREALGQIDAEISRIDQNTLETIEAHKEELHVYTAKRKELEAARAAMVELKKETAKQLGIDDNAKSGPEAKAA